MKVFVPEGSGFCSGVKGASIRVLRERQRTDRPIAVVGPLIHNQHYVSYLESQGIQSVTSAEEADSNSLICVRTHGMPKEKLEHLQADWEVLDLTCPKVTRIQRQIAEAVENHWYVVITGHREHPEVLGHVSHAPDQHVVVETLVDLETLVVALPALAQRGFRDLLVISQSTFSRDIFLQAWEILREAFRPYGEAHFIDSTCSVTTRKEEKALELQKQVDASIVIGDAASSNAHKLYDVLRRQNAATFIVSDLSELTELCRDPEVACHAWQSVQVVSSASTPDFIEREVVAWLEGMAEQKDSVWQARLSQTRELVNQKIWDILQIKVLPFNNPLCEQMEAFAMAGSHFRSKLLVGSYLAYDASERQLESALIAGAALELLQAGLLVHDDVMDEDDVRRGQATVHAVYRTQHPQPESAAARHFGYAQAISVGDWYLSLAQSLLGELPVDARVAGQVKRCFQDALQEVIAGQMQDMQSECAEDALSVDAILATYRRKTAAYTTVLPLHVGALLGGADAKEQELLSQIGVSLGILYQMQDDENNLLTPSQQSGKPQGGDFQRKKQTLLRRALSQQSPKPLEDMSLEQIQTLYRQGTFPELEQLQATHRARIQQNLSLLSVHADNMQELLVYLRAF